jgi:radical SAM protein with 4Fe4S-binding SPASM domain
MVDISKLLCGQDMPGDQLRYSASSHRRPVVVWNTTRRCNLHCVHCYASAGETASPDELTTAEGRALIDDLASYGAPVLLFSGGEPTMREDLLELMSLATSRGLRAVISTNGTLITPEMARDMKGAGVVYVGVSLDGLGEAHDRFRGKKGAFEEALRGLANARRAGLKTGIRFTITRFNNSFVPDIFRLLEEEGIDRLCFYHLVYAGRGSQLISWDLTPEERRTTMDLIFDRALDFHGRGLDKDILTVDNHADGVYLYLKMVPQDPVRAQEVYRFLERNGGNSSGQGISAINHLGHVHPDQFWGHYDLGSIRERPFSQIWEDTSDPLLAGLRDRKGRIGGRCARCRFFSLCGGNFRVRAEAVHGDVWAADPACYLTDEEIGIA